MNLPDIRGRNRIQQVEVRPDCILQGSALVFAGTGVDDTEEINPTVTVGIIIGKIDRGSAAVIASTIICWLFWSLPCSVFWP